MRSRTRQVGVCAKVLAMCLGASSCAFLRAQAGEAVAQVVQQPNASNPTQVALQKADSAFRAGYAAMQAGKLEDARQDFAQAAKLAPQLPETHMALGAILVQLGRPDDAIPELEKALKLKP
jgi:Flp pilus assembly protein TadD